jgi:hypothetical protein
MNGSISGQCHCGTVQWQVALPHKITLNCHCNMCRSLNGADYSSWLIFPADQFSVNSGAEALTWYEASSSFSKSFCSTCGSTVSCINDDKFPDHIYVAKGNITSRFKQSAEIQVYTKDKACWVVIDESIPVIN